MAAKLPGQGSQNKTRLVMLGGLDKDKQRLLPNQYMANPGTNIPSSSAPSMKVMNEIAAQKKAALQLAHADSLGFFVSQDSRFGNFILPVIPRLEPNNS